MADLGIKLTPEETAKAFEGIKISPAEMNAAPRSRYAQPPSMSKDDQSLSLMSGPIVVPLSDRIATRFDKRFADSTPPEPSPVERKLKNRDDAETVKDYTKNAAIDAALGKLLRSVVPGEPMIKGSSGTAIGTNAMSNFAKTGAPASFMSDVLKHWSNKMLGEQAAHTAARALGYTGPEIAAAMSAAGKQAVSAAAPVTRTVTTDRSGSEPEPYRGAMSNAIERLRASAPGNPRAQALLDRIDQIPSDNGAGMNEVTQGTVGNE